MKYQSESWGMKVARKFGMEKLAWSLRRLHCPVDRNALVLEVGSGGNPYYRANVLIDAYETTRERHWAPLVSDRPTCLGVVENLPFKDKTFDFVIASHVLEHSTDPTLFLKELQRVAKAGYIEVPDAFMERINPYKDHRLEITLKDEKLVIRKKPAWRTDEEVVELYEHRAKKWVTRELIPQHPFDFHVRYYWNDKIDFEVLNPQVNAAWDAPVSMGTDPQTVRKNWRQQVQNLSRKLLSQASRNKKINILEILRCPDCHQGAIVQKSNMLECSSCKREFETSHGVPKLFARGVSG